MDLRQFEAFIAVADELSFRRAARRLNITQPPLSLKIKKLEDELGIRLLERNRNNAVTLTVAGEVFLAHARRSIQTAQSAYMHARLAGEGMEGQISIEHSDDFTNNILPDAVSAFSSQYEKVFISHRQELSHIIEENVLLERTDFGFVIPKLEKHDPKLSVLELPDTKIVALVPESHALGRRSSIRLEELKDEHFHIMPTHSLSGFSDKCNELFSEAGFAPKPGVVGLSLHFHLALLQRGFGALLSSESSLPPDLAGVRVLKLRSSRSRLSRHMIYRTTQARPAAERFLAIVSSLAKR